MERQNQKETLEMITDKRSAISDRTITANPLGSPEDDYILGCISAIKFLARRNLSDEVVERRLRERLNAGFTSSLQKQEGEKNKGDLLVIDIKKISLLHKKAELNMEKVYSQVEISIDEWVFRNKKSFRVYLYHCGLKESWNDKRYMWRVSATDYVYSFDYINVDRWSYLFKFDSIDFYDGFMSFLRNRAIDCTVDNIYDNTSVSKIYTSEHI